MSVNPRFLEGVYLKRYGKIAKNVQEAYARIWDTQNSQVRQHPRP